MIQVLLYEMDNAQPSPAPLPASAPSPARRRKKRGLNAIGATLSVAVLLAVLFTAWMHDSIFADKL